MSKKVFIAIILVIFSSTNVLSQTATESWLRTVTSSCAGGLGNQIKHQFEVKFLKRLHLLHSDDEGVERFEISDVRLILEDLNEASSDKTFSAYINCFIQMTNLVSLPEGVALGNVVLDVEDITSSLKYVPTGTRFDMTANELVAFGTKKYLITFSDLDLTSSRAVFRISNTVNGGTDRVHVHKGAMFKVADCNIVLYELKFKPPKVSLFSVCK